MPGMLLIHLCCSRKGLPPFAMLSEVLTLRRHRASACFEETAVRSFRIAWSRLLAAYAKWSYQHPAISQQTPHLRRFSPTSNTSSADISMTATAQAKQGMEGGVFSGKRHLAADKACREDERSPVYLLLGMPRSCCHARLQGHAGKLFQVAAKGHWHHSTYSSAGCWFWDSQLGFCPPGLCYSPDALPLHLLKDFHDSAASPLVPISIFFSLREIYVMYWSASHSFMDTESIKKKNLILNDMSY